jgi:hypothetical protein
MRLGQTERAFRATGARDDDVLGRHIAVQDAAAWAAPSASASCAPMSTVRRAPSVRSFRSVVRRLTPSTSSVDQEIDAVLVAAIVDDDDTRVVEAGDDGGFAAEARDPFVIGGDLLIEHLDRDVPPQPGTRARYTVPIPPRRVDQDLELL